MGFVKDKILPVLDNERQLCSNISMLVERMPDTFVLSKENPLDNLTEKIKSITQFYKAMSSISAKSVKGRVSLSVKQREAIGHQRRLRTEIYICNTYIEARKKQLASCLNHLEYLDAAIADIRLWLETNPNDLVERQAKLILGGIDSYRNSCTAFNDTISVLDTGVAAASDFLTTLLPSWDTQLSRSETISKDIESELVKWKTDLL